MSRKGETKPVSSVRRDRWGFFKRDRELRVGTNEASNQACKAHTVQGKRCGVCEQRKPRHEPGWNDMHGVFFLERVTTTPHSRNRSATKKRRHTVCGGARQPHHWRNASARHYQQHHTRRWIPAPRRYVWLEER